MDHHLVAAVEHQHHGLQQPRMGIEPEPKLTTRQIIVQRFDPQGSFGGLLGDLGGNAVLEGAGVYLHAA